jgi:hypothetical protein
MEQHTLINVNKRFNMNTSIYLRTSRGQSSNLYLNDVNFLTPLLIRHLRKHETLAFLHWCLNHDALLILGCMVSANTNLAVLPTDESFIFCLSLTTQCQTCWNRRCNIQYIVCKCAPKKQFVLFGCITTSGRLCVKSLLAWLCPNAMLYSYTARS